jgi:iron-sulfur cluster repair protein YtfE (RIC family)
MITPATTTTTIDVEQVIETLCVCHSELLTRTLPRIGELADEAAAANPGLDELPLLRHRVRLLADELRRAFEREEHALFSMIRRLFETRILPPCHAGMVAARIRFTTPNHESILMMVDDVHRLAAAQISPSGPCEFCHSIVEALVALRSRLAEHFELEQNVLFKSAIEREAKLSTEPSAST